MPRSAISLRNVRFSLNKALIRPQTLAFLPALMLGGYWFGGEGVLMLTAVTFPLLLLLGDILGSDTGPVHTDSLTGLASRDHLIDTLDRHLIQCAGKGQSTIAFVVMLEDFSQVSDTVGSANAEQVLCRMAERVSEALRPDDLAAKLSGPQFGLVLKPVRHANLETGIRISERIQASVNEPVSIDGHSVNLRASIGFCLARRSPGPSADAMLEAAGIAMEEAHRFGSGAIRAYSPEMHAVVETNQSLMSEISAAFDDGCIIPYFQPQISTETGRVTGFEALARWKHPDRGVLTPGSFLEAIDGAGLLERLGEVMLFQGLSALRLWDRAGFNVPRMGFNFSGTELRNPRLVEKLSWELDRFDLTPDRLNVEILETVVADSENDTITSNIAALAQMGCRIDLDDFGTGHASITSIRRFAASRIKIDRSFIARVDTDPEQRKMVSAILSMAEQLDLETLAEGVESLGEHSMMSQLGCHHVQGYSVARPMPFEDTMAWMERHASKLSTGQLIDYPASG